MRRRVLLFGDVIRLHKMEHYIVCQIGSFDMPLNRTVLDDVAKSVVMKMSDKGCNCHVGSIGGQWQFIVIYDQNCETLPKGQLHREIIVRCQPKGWITRAGIGVEQQDIGGPEKTGCWSLMLLRDI
jgi:hypothetical protein